MRNILYSLLVLISMGFISSCSDDDSVPVVKSSDKEILSFNLSGLSPVVTGEISNIENEINLIVPNGTDVTALISTIEISPKATVSPSSGTAVNFSTPVAFTVKAEDDTEKIYLATVVISTEVDFTVVPFDVTDIQQDNVLIISGTNFGSDYTKNKVVLRKKGSDPLLEYTIPVSSVFSSTRMYAKIPADAALGEYDLVIYVGAQSYTLDQDFKIIPHSPQIDGIEDANVYPGETVTITGKYFSASGNIVNLNKNGVPAQMPVAMESTTSITFTVPLDYATGSYTISVITSGVESYYNTAPLVVSAKPTLPVITGINKTTFKRGETIIITGTNLKKVGVATNINFMPFPSGTTLVRSGVANTEGTQVTYTIPLDFPLDDYTIAVEVDFEYSNDYGDAILIVAQ